MRNLYYRFLAFLQNIGVLRIVVQTRPLSKADELMKTQLLSAVSQLIRTDTEDLHLVVGDQTLVAYVRGRALYLPGQESKDGRRTYFAVTPAILGKFYWADKFFEFTGRVQIVDLQFLYKLVEAIDEWLEAFYDAEDTADLYDGHRSVS
ncbi:hypothetical protein AUJ42_03555 [Candidatus Collierbacteria bacterium CG1_02_44_10]|uniref:Uncharacterized protein n=2 Tax=Candidatus Collieribacteriota TaxID=1752725 RepID=A0A2H0DUL3_9BACT|nr:MAG: hypothetical protein AUJ42_03555 [Candidatus Collierbacteria bacterium CG1_02_44_10]PIP85844.1 MAG: hypothetical protein COW83_02130 [Candidatus Collierbacteria bacterium CG22_combo_CG10-13_8_21_14_all_43_12]